MKLTWHKILHAIGVLGAVYLGTASGLEWIDFGLAAIILIPLLVVNVILLVRKEIRIQKNLKKMREKENKKESASEQNK